VGRQATHARRVAATWGGPPPSYHRGDAPAVDAAAPESVCTTVLYSGTEAEHEVARPVSP
jgi:hypothetical protein